MTLTWEPSAQADHFVVSRNGSVIVNDVTTTTYRDRTVWPGASYVYSVHAIGGDGSKSKEAKTKIKLGKPPLDQARLSGEYDVRMTPASFENTTKPDPFAARFEFKPTCSPSEGACDVRWTVAYGVATGVLARSGLSYDGTAHGTYLLRDCHGDDANVTIAIHVEVKAARSGGDRSWEVSRIEGTFSQVSEIPSGCSGGVNIDWKFVSG